MGAKPTKKSARKSKSMPVRAVRADEATQVRGGKAAGPKLMEACAPGVHIAKAT